MSTKTKQLIFPCNILGKIMNVNPAQPDLIDDECAMQLAALFVNIIYKRQDKAAFNFNEADAAQLEDAITLLNAVDGTPFKRNSTAVTNTFITGSPNLYIGKSVQHALHTCEFRIMHNAPEYYQTKMQRDETDTWPAQGYMALTGAQKHTIAFCLVNATAETIIKQKQKASPLWGDGRGAALVSPFVSSRSLVREGDGRGGAEQIEINHIFNLKQFIQQNPKFDLHTDIKQWTYDIPAAERCHTLTITRNNAKILAIYDRITELRDSLLEFGNAESEHM